eukprot:PhM_4_TR7814/c0_g1_i1/m.14787
MQQRGHESREATTHLHLERSRGGAGLARHEQPPLECVVQHRLGLVVKERPHKEEQDDFVEDVERRNKELDKQNHKAHRNVEDTHATGNDVALHVPRHGRPLVVVAAAREVFVRRLPAREHRRPVHGVVRVALEKGLHRVPDHVGVLREVVLARELLNARADVGHDGLEVRLQHAVEVRGLVPDGVDDVHGLEGELAADPQPRQQQHHAREDGSGAARVFDDVLHDKKKNDCGGEVRDEQPRADDPQRQTQVRQKRSDTDNVDQLDGRRQPRTLHAEHLPQHLLCGAAYTEHKARDVAHVHNDVPRGRQRADGLQPPRPPLLEARPLSLDRPCHALGAALDVCTVEHDADDDGPDEAPHVLLDEAVEAVHGRQDPNDDEQRLHNDPLQREGVVRTD